MGGVGSKCANGSKQKQEREREMKRGGPESNWDTDNRPPPYERDRRFDDPKGLFLPNDKYYSQSIFNYVAFLHGCHVRGGPPHGEPHAYDHPYDDYGGGRDGPLPYGPPGGRFDPGPRGGRGDIGGADRRGEGGGGGRRGGRGGARGVGGGGGRGGGGRGGGAPPAILTAEDLPEEPEVIFEVPIPKVNVDWWGRGAQSEGL